MCGAYAVVNAVGALWPESMDDSRRDELMHRMRDALGPKRWADMTLDGASILTITMMITAAVRFSKGRLKGTLTYSTPFKTRMRIREIEWWDDLAGYVGGDDAVAIIGMSAPYPHWTCITEMNAIRAKLQDSDGEKAIHVSELGFTGSTRPKQVDWRQVFVLERVW